MHTTPDNTEGDNSWRFYAECRKQIEVNPELQDIWFPDDELDPEENAFNTNLAQAICAICPVRASCLNSAKENGETTGVWGGLLFPIRRRRTKKPGDSSE